MTAVSEPSTTITHQPTNRMNKNTLKISLVALATTLTLSLSAQPFGNSDRPSMERPPSVEGGPDFERPELPEDIQSDVDAFRAEQEALRSELEARLSELEDPTREDIQAERAAFREENLDRFEAQRELGQQIREDIRTWREDEGIGMGPPERPELPEDLQADIDTHRAERQALREELRTVLNSLEDDSPEAREEAIEAFREDNADRIAANRELGAQIREDVEAFREDNGLPTRGDLPPALREARRDIALERQEMRQVREQFRADLASAESEEERLALVQAHREAMREHRAEIRELRRQMRQVAEDLSGDRRPDDGE